MILLQKTTDPQTVTILADVDRDDLPLAGVSFDFTDLYSGSLITATGTLTRSGIATTAEITVDLREDSKYDLRVTSNSIEIYKDTVFITNQSPETYSVNNGDYVFFDTGITNNNALIIFEP